MEDVIGTIITLIMFIAVPLIIKAAKAKQQKKKAAPPPPAHKIPLPQPAQGQAKSAVKKGSIDLSFLEDAFESLGIDIPNDTKQKLRAAAPAPEPEYEQEYEDEEDEELELLDHPGHDAHPRALAAPAYELAAAQDDAYDIPGPDQEFRPATGSEGLLDGLEDYWDRKTGQQRSAKVDFLVDAVVLQSVFAPIKKR